MTNRTLVLLRHAKAEAATGASDIERRLTSRGHADAAAAGAWLRSHGLQPDLVICSPAKRTRQTWHAVAVSLAGGVEEPVAGQGRGQDQPAGAAPAPAGRVAYERAVYDGGAAGLLRLIKEVDEATSTVLLIGHNPTISQLSMLLDPDSHLDSDGLRTAGLAVHRFTGAWALCGPGSPPQQLVASHTARS